MSSAGFTLAEVLITLGIIGVVAALTIPGLMSAYKKHVIETRIVKLYSSFNQAIKLSETENESCESWNWGDENNHRDSAILEQWWMTYINPYMPEVATSKVLSVPSESISGNGQYLVILKDGFGIMIEALPGSYGRFILIIDATKLYDKKGLSKGLNRAKMHPGIDYFMFKLFPYKSCSLTPSTSSNNREIYKQQCLNDFLRTGGGGGASCARLIKDNGWKIPGDYPIKL